MFQFLSGAWALLLGMMLLMLGNGIQSTLLGIRGEIEGFSTFEMSLVMSAYFVGFLGGSRMAPDMIRRVGHVRVFAALAVTLCTAMVIIVISVMSRNEEGFSGTALLDLMLACGLRYCRDMQIFHRFETQDPHSELQFSMVNVIKPGTFPLDDGVDFTTPGISLLMPLPGAQDSSAAFEAMVETAMVVVRHLGGELKDENQSVMTAQTVGFARERVQEFERRHRLHRTQAN